MSRFSGDEYYESLPVDTQRRIDEIAILHPNWNLFACIDKMRLSKKMFENLQQENTMSSFEGIMEYDNLAPKMKSKVNEIKVDYPGWDFSACLTQAQFEVESRKMARDIGGPIDGNDPETRKTLLEKVADIIKADFPQIWRTVRPYFDQAIQWLGEIIAQGLQSIKEAISNAGETIIEWIRDVFFS